MDAFENAILRRHLGALTELMNATPGASQASKAKAFSEMARLTALERFPENIVPTLQRSDNPLVEKAASAHSTLDDVWSGPDAQALAQAFIGSVGEPDVLTAIARYGRVLDKATSRVLIASGAVGDVAAEGAVKVVRKLDLNLGGATDFRKAVSLVVLSGELLSKTGEAGRALFEQELGRALVRAANDAVLASLVDSDTTTVSAGADPLASLRAGLMAAGPSRGYIVAAPAGWVAWLSTHEAGRGMGVRGGTFVPGVEVVAQDGATRMLVIPAERLTFFDGGVELRASGAAVVDMADEGGPATRVSMWQTNSYALMVERRWRIDGDTTGVAVVG